MKVILSLIIHSEKDNCYYITQYNIIANGSHEIGVPSSENSEQILLAPLTNPLFRCYVR